MKVLLDTNVLLSAAWRDRLPEKVVQHVATASDCQWIVTAEILAEYVNVLRRPKFALTEAVVQQWAELVQMRTLLIPSPPDIANPPRDPKDTKFLAAAIAANADYLVTGDNDLLQASASVATRVVTVADFATALNIR
jgi:putative PIN family toxin of toxin-antitoxin system